MSDDAGPDLGDQVLHPGLLGAGASLSLAFPTHPWRGWLALGNQGQILAKRSPLCLLVIEVASGEYGDLNPMLFRAVQNGLCTMAEKKSSPEKNEVPTPCPPCPQVSRGGEGREGKVGEGRWDNGRRPCQRGFPQRHPNHWVLGGTQNLE